MAASELRERRAEAERAWVRWADRLMLRQPDGSHRPENPPRPEILASWRRSDPASIDRTSAPLGAATETAEEFSASPLSAAVDRLTVELRRTADDGDLVVAVADPATRILWTYGGRVMRRYAERVNFVPGGLWDEHSIGTNALNLALATDSVQAVFAAEHLAPLVHNWVCWAAPIHDPLTGEQLGVLDLSTTWDRAHPIGTATARALARLLESALPELAVRSARPATTGGPGLTLAFLGGQQAFLDGRPVLLTRRQAEILALLSLHPEGLTLDRLHGLLYGDRLVSTGTVKAEISHLRTVLGDVIASRPYRLVVPVRTDLAEVAAAVRADDPLRALGAYRGDLLPGTDAPGLVEHAAYLAVAVRELALAHPDPEVAVRYAEVAPQDAEVARRALAGLGDRPHPLRARLVARTRCGG